MTVRSAAAVFGVIVLVATGTAALSRTAGSPASAAASSQDPSEHAATMRGEALYARCKQQYGTWPETGSIRASNSLAAACMRNGGRRI
jgi:hypothetical protein